MAEPDARKLDWPDEPKLFSGSEEEWLEEEKRRSAEVRAGRFITNDAVMRWLDDFIATGKKGPRPQVGE